MKEWRQTLVPVLVSLVVAIVLWELVVRLFGVPDYILPRPEQVVLAIGSNSSVLWDASLVTLLETVLGFITGVVVGVVVSILITSSHLLNRMVYPVIVALQVVPKIAVAPLFVVWFGFGLLPKVIIAFLIAFFPVVVDTTIGLESLDPDMQRLADSMGGGRLRNFRKFRFPNALPSFFGALRIAITLAVVGAITGEFVGASNGLGYVVLSAAGDVNTPLVFASIILMTLLGVILFFIVEVIERLSIPWYRSSKLDISGRP